ncbi:hypothetical protein OEA41_005546 [Lepraria neglecta]|uniref:Uncharacterized protein n=1 Tax=Lepraria neglecta TaxID=209136 RepID=A0AAD9ZH99_9LECA|nr:hypothetical protein OEA41_005546 [Lepraria neglecta]
MQSEIESEPFLKETENSRFEHQNLIVSAASRGKASIPSRLSSHFLICLITSLFWGALLHLMLTHRRSPHGAVTDNAVAKIGNAHPSPLIAGAKYLLCGNSTEEAKNLGCEYDILSNHWLPAPCLDQDAVHEYQSDGSWFGYADEDRTQVLSIDAMSEEPFYYTNMRDHIIHCAMLWRKQYRALYEERRGLDSIIVDEEHTLHCSNFLIRMTEHGPDFSKVPIKVEVGFAGCYLRDGHYCN